MLQRTLLIWFVNALVIGTIVVWTYFQEIRSYILSDVWSLRPPVTLLKQEEKFTATRSDVTKLCCVTLRKKAKFLCNFLKGNVRETHNVWDLFGNCLQTRLPLLKRRLWAMKCLLTFPTNFRIGRWKSFYRPVLEWIGKSETLNPPKKRILDYKLLQKFLKSF